MTDALISSLLITKCTLFVSLERYKASSAAVSPPPTTATSCPLKKNPSQTAQADTPFPFSLCSDSRFNHLADAPVEIITDFAIIFSLESEKAI